MNNEQFREALMSRHNYLSSIATTAEPVFSLTIDNQCLYLYGSAMKIGTEIVLRSKEDSHLKNVIDVILAGFCVYYPEEAKRYLTQL